MLIERNHAPELVTYPTASIACKSSVASSEMIVGAFATHIGPQKVCPCSLEGTIHSVSLQAHESKQCLMDLVPHEGAKESMRS